MGAKTKRTRRRWRLPNWFPVALGCAFGAAVPGTVFLVYDTYRAIYALEEFQNQRLETEHHETQALVGETLGTLFRSTYFFARTYAIKRRANFSATIQRFAREHSGPGPLHYTALSSLDFNAPDVEELRNHAPDLVEIMLLDSDGYLLAQQTVDDSFYHRLRISPSGSVRKRKSQGRGLRDVSIGDRLNDWADYKLVRSLAGMGGRDTFLTSFNSQEQTITIGNKRTWIDTITGETESAYFFARFNALRLTVFLASQFQAGHGIYPILTDINAEVFYAPVKKLYNYEENWMDPEVYDTISTPLRVTERNSLSRLGGKLLWTLHSAWRIDNKQEPIRQEIVDHVWVGVYFLIFTALFAPLAGILFTMPQRRVERRLEAVQSTASDVIIVINDKGKIVSCNKAIEDMLIYSRSELIGSDIAVIVPKAQRESHRKGFSNYLRTGEAKLVNKGAITVRALRADRAEIDVDLSISSFKEKYWFGFRERQFFTGIIRDKTTEVQQQAAIQEREKRLAATLNTVVDAVVIVSENKRIREINPATTFLFGYPRKELIGKHIRILFAEEEQSAFDDYICDGTTAPERHGQRLSMACRRGGRNFHMEFAAAEFVANGVRYYNVVLRDVDERVKQQQQLAERQDDIETFARSTNHDLKNYLGQMAILCGRLNILIRKNGLLEHEKFVDTAKRFRGSVSAAQNTLKGMGTFLYVAQNLEFETVNLRDMFDAAQQIDFGGELRLEGEFPEVVAAPGILPNALMNIVSNAFRHGYGDDRSGKVVHVYMESGELVIRDDAGNLDASLWEQYKKTGVKGEKSEGSGFGMAIIDKILRKHKWNWYPRVEPGVYTEIRITISAEQQPGITSTGGNEVKDEDGYKPAANLK